MKSVMKEMMEQVEKEEHSGGDKNNEDWCIQCNTDRPRRRSTVTYDGKCNGHIRGFQPIDKN